MSYSISTLLLRNLDDVFGENDPARRRKAIDEIFTKTPVYYDRNGVYRGRDEIERIAGAIRASHPDYRFFGTDGRRAALGMGHLTPGLISSSLRKTGLLPFIAFTTGLSTTAWPHTAHSAVNSG